MKYSDNQKTMKQEFDFQTQVHTSEIDNQVSSQNPKTFSLQYINMQWTEL